MIIIISLGGAGFLPSTALNKIFNNWVVFWRLSED